MRLFTLFLGFLWSLSSMASTLYVTEFLNVPSVSVYYQAAQTPMLVTQAITISGSSAQSAAFGSTTGLIRVHTDVACNVVIGGTNPTATTTSMRLAADQTEYFIVQPGAKLAVILAP